MNKDDLVTSPSEKIEKVGADDYYKEPKDDEIYTQEIIQINPQDTKPEPSIFDKPSGGPIQINPDDTKQEPSIFKKKTVEEIKKDIKEGLAKAKNKAKPKAKPKTTTKKKAKKKAPAKAKKPVAPKELEMKCVLLNDNAIAPERKDPLNAGIDFFSSEDLTIKPNETELLKTGVAVEIPSGHYGQLHDRSGVAIKTSLCTKGGVIDENYRGEIGIVLVNTGNKYEVITLGTKIAQMVIIPVPKVKVVVVKELSKTDRGEKGFGSSGDK